MKTILAYSLRQVLIRSSIAAIILLLNLPVQGQFVFQRTYGGSGSDYCRTVRQTSDGGYILAESTLSFGAGDQDLYMLKVDEQGDLDWAHAYGGVNWDAGRGAQQTSDGGYILIGNIGDVGAGGSDMLLVKTDALGNEVWAKTYGGPDAEMGYHVIQTSDGGYFLVGRTDSYGAGTRDFYAVKTDSNGDTLWTKTYGGGNFDECMFMQQTTDGGYILVGPSKSYGSGQYDIYLVKIDVNGTVEWTKAYGGSDDEYPYSVLQTTDGGYIVCGRTKTFGLGLNDVYIIKTDAFGDTLWTRAYGGTDDEWGFDIQQTPDGGYLITGSTKSFGAGDKDVYLLKIDNSGAHEWSKAYGGTAFDDALSIRLTSDGGAIMAGRTLSFGSGSFDVYLIKVDDVGYSGGCNEVTANTIVSNTATIVTTGSYEASGSTVGTASSLSTNTSTIETMLCSDTVVISMDSPGNSHGREISIYPNPSSGIIYVENNLDEEIAISILNNVGELITDLKGQEISPQRMTFDLSAHANGVYIVRIVAADQVITRRIVFAQ